MARQSRVTMISWIVVNTAYNATGSAMAPDRSADSKWVLSCDTSHPVSDRALLTTCICQDSQYTTTLTWLTNTNAPTKDYENGPYGQHVNKTKIRTKIHLRTQTSQHHTKLAPCCSSYEQPGGYDETTKECVRGGSPERSNCRAVSVAYTLKGEVLKDTPISTLSGPRERSNHIGEQIYKFSIVSYLRPSHTRSGESPGQGLCVMPTSVCAKKNIAIYIYIKAT